MGAKQEISFEKSHHLGEKLRLSLRLKVQIQLNCKKI